MEAERIETAIGILKAEVRSLDPALVDPGLAHRLVSLLAEGERVCAAGTALLASRIADAPTLARVTGTSVGKARAVVGLSHRLGDTPQLEEAVRRAQVSLDQATEIARAETAAPGVAPALVEVAQDQPFHVLREQARRLALLENRKDLASRQRKARRACHWITDLGLVHLEADLEPHLGVPIVERLEASARRLAREAEDPESFSAHLADAFAHAFGGPGGKGSPKAELVVLVSHQVAQRGWAEIADDELCSIPGVGPIDPKVAQEIAQDAFLSGVFFDGVDLRQIRRWTRYVPVEVRLALNLGPPPEFDGARCVDCGNRFGLEYDHERPHAAGGPTSLDNLRPRCGRCHRRKTAGDRWASHKSRVARDPPET